MKAMPLPFEEFQGKGVLNFSCKASDSFSLLLHQPQKWTTSKEDCYVGTEPTSVLDARRSPSPPTSSTMSSSLGSNSAGKASSGSGCSTNSTTGVATTVSEKPSQTTALDSAADKCGLRMEDWESVLSESPGQDQSILRLIMGDVEDPSAGLSKLLQSTGGVSQNIDFHGGFGVVDQGFELEPITSGSSIDPSVPGNCPGFPFNAENIESTKVGSVPIQDPIFSASASNPLLVSQQQQVIGVADEKPQVINPQFLLNQSQVHFSENPSFFVPLSYPQMPEHRVFSQPQAKRLLSDTIGQSYQMPKLPFLDSGQELLARRQQAQLQTFPHHLQQRQSMLMPPEKLQKVNSTGDELATHQLQLQQSIADQLFKIAELIEAGNPVIAQGILARLNHQLSPIGKPFQRAAFYMKEALQLLLHSNTHNMLAFSPITFIFKIGAYKSFSEISPVTQFANFTCNQALIEAVESYERIHIFDFDIGFGVQWASFMQELALRSNGVPSLKVTAVVSPSACDEVELSFTRENLKQYAKEINISFELNVMSIESLNSGSWPMPARSSDSETIAVNWPISSFSNHPSLFPLALRFVKQLMPKVVVTLDRSCDRTDIPFPHSLIHALQSYSALLESLDAVNVNLDVLQKIEKHFVQPAIEKMILGRHQSREKLPPWRNLLLSSGFSPSTFSNFTEAQAECLVQRAPVRGFHVEKKQSSLALCWQRKELISVSAWRC
ncbi:hypothetical protein L6164_000732 [Bauhinia variegata]|uniref:Uncharacterized protein n=1 Tax=Bauhinia variegata TaxID=167791 RepID=A0ACB9Q7D7_BAUVA|nr:hypothetical protein L6164_000732 [Bauhinia variegata]